ncbi:MAG: magnesium/cobalt transporter CorA [Gammaproteobacteria bacterium]|nr:magnesium/cobalt transporter CorA [Gammaproteobacteria bacterium]
MTDTTPREPARRRGSRRKHFVKRTAAGSAPGQLLPDPNAHPTTFRLTTFDAKGTHEHPVASLAEVERVIAEGHLIWLDVMGLRDVDMLQTIARMFEIHPLVREDIVNVHQRAKTEDYGRELYVVAHLMQIQQEFRSEQISIVLGKQFVISFQEIPDDSFAQLRTRLCATGSLRQMSAGHLTYLLLDAILDSYFPAMEQLGDRLEQLEDQVLKREEPAGFAPLHEVRRMLIDMRRTIWPHREMVNSLMRFGDSFLQSETEVYLRDCQDHAVQILDMLETYREIAAGLLELHLSNQANRLNEIMKVLTIIATIFIPLSFIASLYGMNFDREVSPWNMPELGWRYGYITVIGVMALAALALLVWFWRKGWLKDQR